MSIVRRSFSLVSSRLKPPGGKLESKDIQDLIPMKIKVGTKSKLYFEDIKLYPSLSEKSY